MRVSGNRFALIERQIPGEPEPVRPPRPEHAYPWIRRSPLSVAATVTVATGSTFEEVLLAFGADPDRPEAIRAIELDPHGRRSPDPWVAVLATAETVLAVEYNGFHGSHEPGIGTEDGWPACSGTSTR